MTLLLFPILHDLAEVQSYVKPLLWEPNECLPALAQSEFCCCVSLDFVVGMLILLKQGWLDFDLKR